MTEEILLEEIKELKKLLKFKNKGALTATEAMEYLSIGRNTLIDLAAEGKIKAISLGDSVNSKKIYPVYSLDEYLRNETVEKTKEPNGIKVIDLSSDKVSAN